MNALVQLPLQEQFQQESAPSLVYLALSGVRQAHPHLGLQHWSRLLATSEGELQASRLGQENIHALEDVFSLLYQLSSLEEVEVTSFNDGGQVSYLGSFSAPELCLQDPSQLGLKFTSGSQEISFFLEDWYWGCALEEEDAQGEQQWSLQFFDREGKRFLKIAAVAGTALNAWMTLVETFSRSQQQLVRPLFATRTETRTQASTLNPDSFCQAWRQLGSPSQVNQLLNQQGINYRQAVELLEPRLARSVSIDSLESLLAAQQQLGGCGCKSRGLRLDFYTPGSVQGCRGYLRATRLERQEWQLAYCGGRIDLNPAQLGEAFLVRTPKGQGWMTSLDIFSDTGQLVLQVREDSDPEAAENLLVRNLFTRLQ
ncbi:ChuX/HutX family heme-like substrate-binding protein [Marinospirillum perlucidum]|uniref:ChuX/HutX family heme-like substrate-binding protein n=1 Tax=Marinospirillum perlucidum TaxID=1982602 RepID=UPI000DF1EB2A|nr:ChuX/HutX family heme-like substrate-binding protein [Marinospirillum perlucidum]